MIETLTETKGIRHPTEKHPFVWNLMNHLLYKRVHNHASVQDYIQLDNEAKGSDSVVLIHQQE